MLVLLTDRCRLMKQLQDCMASLKDDGDEAVSWSVDSECVVSDNQWYRAIITEINDNSTCRVVIHLVYCCFFIVSK